MCGALSVVRWDSTSLRREELHRKRKRKRKRKGNWLRMSPLVCKRTRRRKGTEEEGKF